MKKPPKSVPSTPVLTRSVGGWGGYAVVWSIEEIDRREWINDHSYKISEAVRCSNNYELLRAIADMVGYKGGT